MGFDDTAAQIVNSEFALYSYCYLAITVQLRQIQTVYYSEI